MCPKISIITVTYNSAKTVEETILSILRQKYPNLEYIIVDGASKDNTLEIINRYKEHITTIISEPDNGISDAFNKGVKIASGDLIGLINSDDVMVSGALQIVADAYDPAYDVYRGHTILWDDINGTKLSMKPSMSYGVNCKWNGSVNHPSTFISKRAYNICGFYNTDYRYSMDIDMLYRLYNQGLKAKYINKDLVLFRIGGETSSLWAKKIKERYKIVRSNGGSYLLCVRRLGLFALKQSMMQMFCIIFPQNMLYKIKYRKSM